MNDIPLEIWHHIASSVDSKGDCLRFRLVSHFFDTIFTPIAVSSISVGIEVACKPRNFTYTSHRMVKTRPFSPVPAALAQHITSLHVDIGPIQPHQSVDPELGAVWFELARLRMVKSLRVSCLDIDSDATCNNVDVTPVLNTILDAVIHATNARLTSLHLNLSRSNEIQSFPDSLGKLCRLETFEFSYTCDKNRQIPSLSSLTQLSTIIKNNPCITTLRSRRFGAKNPICLNDIFPPGLDPMDVEQLMIFGHLLPASTSHQPLTLPALSRLQHLHLFHDIFTPTINIDQFWDALKHSGTELKSLKTLYVTPALLDYLASFRGLKDCTLDLIRPVDPLPISIAAVQRAFSAHASTLEALLIETHDKGLSSCFEAFAFSPATWPDPSHFSKLTGLVVPCLQDNFGFTEENHALLLQFVARFPGLSVLDVRWYGTYDSQASSFPKHFCTETGRPHKITIQHDGYGRSSFANDSLFAKTKQ